MLMGNVSNVKRSLRNGFTLVELLVVIGIIALLISMLLPSLSKARNAANQVVCASNLRQIGMQMLAYSDANQGYLFPYKDENGETYGHNAAHVYQSPPNSGNWVHTTWPLYVFGVWNPKLMICPGDVQPQDSLQGTGPEEHSYLVNAHMSIWSVKYSSPLPNHTSPSAVVLMGEKVTAVSDYYMEIDDFNRVVAQYRHGLAWGSNYMMLDLHVEQVLPQQAETALDPWDFANGATPPAGTASGS